MLESLFNKVAGLKVCNFIEKRLQHRCKTVEFAKFLRTSFFTEHLRWLLLVIQVTFADNPYTNFSFKEAHEPCHLLDQDEDEQDVDVLCKACKLGYFYN